MSSKGVRHTFSEGYDLVQECALSYTCRSKTYTLESVGYYQPKFGTAIAYAKQKKKIVLNILY